VPLSKGADERLAETDSGLDGFERGLGVPALAGEDEVTVEARRLLGMAPSAVRKMGAVECGESAYVLGQFAFRLQQAQNREQGRVTWATEAVKRTIAPRVDKYSGYSFEERKLKAVRDDEAASKLDAIRVRAQMRLDRLSFMAARADGLVKTLLSLKNTKGNRD
jgi:hypothetical protein